MNRVLRKLRFVHTGEIYSRMTQMVEYTNRSFWCSRGNCSLILNEDKSRKRDGGVRAQCTYHVFIWVFIRCGKKTHETHSTKLIKQYSAFQIASQPNFLADNALLYYCWRQDATLLHEVVTLLLWLQMFQSSAVEWGLFSVMLLQSV